MILSAIFITQENPTVTQPNFGISQRFKSHFVQNPIKLRKYKKNHPDEGKAHSSHLGWTFPRFIQQVRYTSISPRMLYKIIIRHVGNNRNKYVFIVINVIINN